MGCLYGGALKPIASLFKRFGGGKLILLQRYEITAPHVMHSMLLGMMVGAN